ncbi:MULTISPECIES: precorrin-2 C(20)-methyltransferase [Pseudonocardia]|uniref:Precorrin-3B C(17)-methyltransferase n=2 Tax=Pseudonocardia TaxID=1847 RepID=A0A1Y2N6U5_PSEAH|nr:MULTISPECIES: precorrin-2 C(20)-methyltransferase [Pseudonocardia]OSY42899.1 Precorrin-3B C(17)-methyltransferase [Pseudonocardia autotrophica]TDN77477.1 precorrin-2 C20-methyltransferase/precorrin-3B C17-methyltransferase [Pseudonocardia autotrophica]BBG01499.1 putative cobalamin biosynthesis protein CobI [Pseudonocardia autotrophica]GEC25283.1 putative cobalamin biosynthesis protein CobI [Pseudonocardia saturnea]
MSSADPTTPSAGTLYGVGLGPGDPELTTIKAARLVRDADVIAYHSARHGRSIARRIAEPHLSGTAIEEALVYPVTTETTDHPGGYQGAIDEFYTEAAARLAAHLDAGRDVVLLAEGDPLFYGSYMHMHKRLAGRYRTEVVPGVTSISGAAAALGRPLVERDEVLTVLPGTLPRAELARRLADTDSAAVMKLGRTFGTVRDALADAGKLDRAHYVERATMEAQRTGALGDVDAGDVPYFAIALVPGDIASSVPDQENDDHRIAPDPADPASVRGPGEVVVVGTGPAGRDWLTPQVAAALSVADDLVGYGPYLDRVPPNPRQTRYPSDNRVEAQRAAHALDLAASGRRVAVVSAGDPGVFAMAAAVLEVASEQKYRDVAVRVLPGLSAAQAVSAAVGAPLGHDHAMISLSDRLKPWDVVAARLRAVAAADLAIAIYNPRSKARPWQVGAAREVLLEHRSPDTPVVLGRDVGGAGQRITVTTLGELDPELVDMRTLVIVGSSTTRVVERGTGPVVFTPRHYETGTTTG